MAGLHTDSFGEARVVGFGIAVAVAQASKDALTVEPVGPRRQRPAEDALGLGRLAFRGKRERVVSEDIGVFRPEAHGFGEECGCGMAKFVGRLRAQERRQGIGGCKPGSLGNGFVSARQILFGTRSTGPFAPDFGFDLGGHAPQAAAAAPVRPAI